jgi:hypothetical protein
MGAMARGELIQNIQALGLPITARALKQLAGLAARGERPGAA